MVEFPQKTPRLEVWIKLPCGKSLLFSLQNRTVYCNDPQLLHFFENHGIPHWKGRRVYPEDREVFLEAVYDFYFLRRYGIAACPHNHRKDR